MPSQRKLSWKSGESQRNLIKFDFPSRIKLTTLDAPQAAEFFQQLMPAAQTHISAPDYIGLTLDFSYGGWDFLKTKEVWTQYDFSWTADKDFDPFQIPDSHHTVAYPILGNDLRRDARLLFQANVVHHKGESFIEFQAYDDDRWFDWVAEFLQEDIEVWEGPIESRFGWYGDESDGRRVLRKHKATESPPVGELSYLLASKHFYYDRDGYRESKGCSAVHGIFRSEAEARDYARENAEKLFVEFDMREITSRNEEGFDFDGLPEVTKNRVRELLDVDEEDDWREEFDLVFIDDWEPAAIREVVQLLEIEPFVIATAFLDDSEFDDLQASLPENKKHGRSALRIAAAAFGLDLMEIEADEWDETL
ncbi:MAG: hypothetical protein AAF483_27520 [Planctomycetota bacterium]